MSRKEKNESRREFVMGSTGVRCFQNNSAVPVDLWESEVEGV